MDWKDISIMKRYIIVFFILLIYMILFFVDNSRFNDIILFKGSSFIAMIAILPPVLVLLGLLEVWIKRDTMMRLIGSESGIKGVIISFLWGSIGLGPLYIVFPVAIVLLKKGARFRNVFIFMGSWATIKISQILFEFNSLGFKFTLVRLVLNIIGISCMAIILEHIVPKEEQERLAENSGIDE